MLEKNIQAKIINFLASAGVVAVKMETSRRGWPDILALLPGGAVVFFEVKQPTGRLSVHQIRTHQLITEQGGYVYTVTSVEDVKEALATYVEQCAARGG
jgi:hypothetical protein